MSFYRPFFGWRAVAAAFVLATFGLGASGFTARRSTCTPSSSARAGRLRLCRQR